MRRFVRRFLLPELAIALILAAPGIAFAHVGVGETSGFAHGFSHPISGLDHILAMVQRWLAPEGTFRQLTHMPWVYYPLYKRYFDDVRFRFVFRNLPPGGVYFCTGYQPRAYAPKYRIPERVTTYTASIEQRLPGQFQFMVGYVGSTGRNLFLRSITNLITNVTTNPTTGAGTAIRQFGGRFAEIDYKTSGGTDMYNSLQSSLQRHFARGLSLGAQYTWAKELGTSS